MNRKWPLSAVVGALALSLVVTLAQPKVFNFVTIAGNGVPGSTDGTNNQIRFNSPNGIALGTDGSIYVADSANYTYRQIKRYGTDWVSTTIAGTPGVAGTADGTNGQALFQDARAVAVGPNGTLFVTDDYTVRTLTPVGTNWVTQTIAGTPGSSGNADGTNNDIQFFDAFGIAVDKSGAVYVADPAYYIVRRLTQVGTNWVSSTIGAPLNYGLVDGTNGTARFLGPFRLALDGAGSLYVADHMDVGNSSGYVFLREITQQGTNSVVTTLGIVPYDSTDQYQEFDVATLSGMAVAENGDIYFTSGVNSTVRELPAHAEETTIGGLGGDHGFADGTNALARFYAPADIAVDADGKLYVADDGNNAIRLGIPLAFTPPAPTLSGVGQTNGEVAFRWTAVPGLYYQVQYSTDLTSTNWTDLGSSTPATNQFMMSVDATGVDGQRFYRVVLLP